MNLFKQKFLKNKINIIRYSFIFIILSLILPSFLTEIKTVNFIQVGEYLRGLPTYTFVKFLVLGLMSLSVMTFYDFIIYKYLGVEINKGNLFSISFLSNSIGNFSGQKLKSTNNISSSLLRSNFKNIEDIIIYDFLLYPATLIGLSFLVLATLFNGKFLFSLLNSFYILYLPFILFFIFLFAYFYLDRIINIFKKEAIFSLSPDTSLIKENLFLASIFNWIINFLFIYMIVSYLQPTNNLFNVFTVFVLASSFGIFSLLPGGIIAFDLIFIIGLKSIGFDLQVIISILIFYRFFYYITPLLISVVSTLIIQTQKDSNLIEFKKIKSFIKKTSTVTNLLLSTLILFSGLTLLIDGLFPYVPKQLNYFSKVLSPYTLEISHHISISIGILLIMISKQIRLKVKRSYYITLGLIFLGIISSIIKGFSYIHMAYLILVLVILYMSKDSFYRKSTPINWILLGLQLIFVFIGLYFYMKSSNIVFDSLININKLDFKILNHFKFKNPFKSSLLTYFILLLSIFYYSATKDRIVDDNRYEKVDKDRLDAFFASYKGNILTHLIYLNDKHLFWSGKDEFLVQYEVAYSKIIVLGDPMGDPDYMEEGFSQFLKFVDDYGYKLVFYQVSESNLSFYHNNGYYIFKLGETGLVNLHDFDLTGSKSRDFRNTLKRFEKDGYSFQVFKSGSLPFEAYDELKSISDEWLGNKSEMSFSLGCFDIDYIKTCDTAIIRHLETDKIIAFSTMIPSYDGLTYSMDLMRLKSHTPNNTMNFLILNLLLYYKDLGYKFFNLGMAPLSNVGIYQNSHFQEKVAHLVFEYGNYFYSFQGLRNFKNKFKPQWEGRYLIYEDFTSLPQSLLEVTTLIHK